MVACANGASVKPGLSTTTQVLVDRSLWETATGTPSSWFDWFLNIVTPSTISVTDLCALNLDDPPLPAPSVLAAALRLDVTALDTVYNYIRDKLMYNAFATACVCNAPASPACDSAYGRPFSPLGSYATNGAGAYDQGIKFTAVLAYAITQWSINGELDDHGTNNIVYKLWDVTAGTLLWTETRHNAGGYQEYTPATVVTMIVGHTYALTFTWTTGMTIGYGGSYAGRSGPAFSTLGSIDNNPSGSGVPSRVLNGQADPIQPIVCQGATVPTAPTVPTQPTDLQLPPSWACTTIGDLCMRLQQVNEKMDWLRRDVTLIQRQSTPFAYLPGVTYSGLTGHASIGVSAILGVSVSLTTVPLSWGRTGDVPRRLIPAAGQLLFSTAQGDGDAQLLHYDQNLILGVSGAVTLIKYSFRPGVVASITPLSREN